VVAAAVLSCAEAKVAQSTVSMKTNERRRTLSRFFVKTNIGLRTANLEKQLFLN
jgi:hypothetical protein